MWNRLVFLSSCGVPQLRRYCSSYTPLLSVLSSKLLNILDDYSNSFALISCCSLNHYHFLAPPPSLTFSDQFAFRPTGSTSAAIISLLHTITTLLQANPYVIVISLDFSKAFDSVRQSTLLSKMSELHHEFNRPLNVPFQDIMCAFDSVDRTALWKHFPAM